MRRDIDAVEKRGRLGRIEHQRLSGCDDMRGPANRMRRVDRHDLTIDRSIEQVPQRREPLLDGGRGELAR
jgi:hypothetical protein